MSESAGVQQGSPAVGAAGSAPAAPGAGGTQCSGAAAGSARIAVKKAQLRSSPRPKKLEKLGVYSACKGDSCRWWAEFVFVRRRTFRHDCSAAALLLGAQRCAAVFQPKFRWMRN
ncbi:hypothetical protein COCON_G00125080 [Conger conger]|uniref:PCAF N-terminal domain-containing protein n=1 Tax=Conger conger TaxID=82655 RepID=A0A9Q1DDA8_CONCO|nr:hypothetical protein COCON_G00125080 [Conger conger]